MIEREDTQFRQCIGTKKRVAITLWCLATPCEYRTISHLFGVARSTVCSIVHETCNAIVSVMLKEYIKFPVAQDLRDVVEGFEKKWGFPQCVGSIDGSHIPISAPELNHTDYYNRKGWFSIVVQAIVDHNYIFRDICVGWPGSVHDARIFANSLIYEKITNDRMLEREGYRMIEGKRIPLCLIGDSAYPILLWLMKPFCANPTLTAEQKRFNYRLSRARVVVEIAFGRLKARWRRLMKRNDMHTDHIPIVITACCILHNLCEMRGESFNDMWLQNEPNFQQPTTSSPPLSSSCSDASTIRETLMKYLNSKQ